MSAPQAGLPLRLGVVLPSFSEHAEAALSAARDCEEAGLDGVFAYDHLWPIERPGEAAISPYLLLAAVGAQTSRISIGTLVARVGLVPNATLGRELRTLARLAPGRFIAGLGTGDSKSAAENTAFGIAFDPPAHRRELLGALARELVAEGVTVWVGGGSSGTDAVAREVGATLNLWGADRSRLAAAALLGPVTWGGALPTDPGAAGARLAAIAAAGASWAVCSWPGSPEHLLGAARAGGLRD